MPAHLLNVLQPCLDAFKPVPLPSCKLAANPHLHCRSLTSTHAAARPPELAAAIRKHRQLLLPRQCALPAAAQAALAAQEQRRQADLIAQLLQPYQTAEQQQLGPAVPVPHLEAAKVHVGAAALQVQRPSKRAQPQQEAPGRPPAPDAAPPPRKRAAPATDGMQYFMQLQRGKGGPGDGAGSGGARSSASSGSGGSAAEAREQYGQQASTAVHTVELPATHAQLLQLLREDEQRLVRATPGVAPEVARSEFLSLDALQRAVAQAAGGCDGRVEGARGVRSVQALADVGSCSTCRRALPAQPAQGPHRHGCYPPDGSSGECMLLWCF